MICRREREAKFFNDFDRVLVDACNRPRTVSVKIKRTFDVYGAFFRTP